MDQQCFLYTDLNSKTKIALWCRRHRGGEMSSYNFWIEQADRWQKCVDFGSPISAWTLEMHETLKEFDGNSLMAGAAINTRRANKLTYDDPINEWSIEMKSLYNMHSKDMDKSFAVLLKRRASRVSYLYAKAEWTQEMRIILDDCEQDLPAAIDVFNKRQGSRATYDIPKEEWSLVMLEILKECNNNKTIAEVKLKKYLSRRPNWL